jgi:L-lysine exporter family protein LysE/ArgO
VTADVLVGLLTGLSLIIAIGAQNAYLLRQALRGAPVGGIVAVCAISDLVLIVAGVAGIGTLIQHASWALDVIRWLGVAVLVFYGSSAAWRARSTEALEAAAGPTDSGARAVLKALALTWLNPHVYLDTVILVGSIANTHGHSGRWWFAAGAAMASLIWFTTLGYGGRRLAPFLATPRAWQVLDLLIAATMLVLAARLALQ